MRTIFTIIFLIGSFVLNAQENMLLNAGFENSTLTNWSKSTLAGANGTVSISSNAHTGNQSCVAITTETNGLINKFSLKTQNYTSNGTTFEAKVMAKTDAAGLAANVKFKIQFIAVSTTQGNKYFVSSEFELTDQFKEYTFTKDLGLEDVTAIKLTFQCGGFLGNYYFDDASLINVTPVEPPISIIPVAITPITKITTANKIIAFTFDDGPDSSLTSQIAKLFEDNGGHATFFNIGNNLAGNESAIQALLNKGHEIGNHSISHARIPDLPSDDEIYHEIVDFQELYKTTFNYTPALFRAPFLDYGQIRSEDLITPNEDNSVGGVLTTKNLLPINASVYANDAAETTTATAVYANLNGNIKGGDIILCHERAHTLEALQTLIPELKAAGFTFVSVSELLQIEQGWTTIAPTDTNIQFEGSNFIKNSNNELQLHRHSDAVYAGSNLSNLFSPISARTCSGVVVKFKTSSPTVNVKFRMAEGKDEKATFGIFQNNEFIATTLFPYVSESEILVESTSQHPGEEVVYKITLPTFTDVHFTGIEVEEGHQLVSFSEAVKPIYVAYGNSITHGRGQSSTHETYPYLLAEKLGYQLFNLGVGGAKTSQVMAEMIRDEFDHIDMMTILIGYNDYNGEGIDIVTYTQRYNNVISTIRSTHPTTKLFCITMTTTTNNTALKTGIAADDFRNVVTTIVNEKKQAGDLNIFLIKGEDLTTESDLNDPVHLNVVGASNFADGLYAKINADLTLSVETEKKKKKN